MDNKYNYFFYWVSYDYHEYMMRDITKLDYVKFITKLPQNASYSKEIIFKIHNSLKINKNIKLPLKKKWFYNYSYNNFINDKPICFIFYASYYWLKSVNYFNYLKTIYPNCKIIMIFMDIVESYIKNCKNQFIEGFDVSYIKKTFDLVLTYNRLDANYYNFNYYPCLYSKNHIYENNMLKKSDVFFVGSAKNRLGKILEIYKILNAEGLICDFHIMDVPNNMQKYNDKIIYNKRLSYYEVLQHIKMTNCILELIQEGSLGFTLRINEAIVYNKKLLTDNPIIKEIKYFNLDTIQYFNNVNEINIELIKNKNKVDYNYNDDFSPINLILYLEDALSE